MSATGPVDLSILVPLYNEQENIPLLYDYAWHKDLVETPLPVASVGLFLLGIQMILIGLLAEMIMRTYYESQSKRAYVIASLRDGGTASHDPANACAA